jgi:Fur family ferric uptake transcriptional regulator
MSKNTPPTLPSSQRPLVQNISSSTSEGGLPGGLSPEASTGGRTRRQTVPAKKIIRDLGLKVTQQRLDILEVVRGGPNHFTAQDVFETVEKRNSEIGFATVYRFLRTLTDSGFVTEVRMGGMPARYEWAAKEHHDHLTCTTCGKIVEFENVEIERLQEKVALRFGFLLTSHVLELYGVCPECRQQNVEQANAANSR